MKTDGKNNESGAFQAVSVASTVRLVYLECTDYVKISDIVSGFLWGRCPEKTPKSKNQEKLQKYISDAPKIIGIGSGSSQNEEIQISKMRSSHQRGIFEEQPEYTL